MHFKSDVLYFLSSSAVCISGMSLRRSGGSVGMSGLVMYPLIFARKFRVMLSQVASTYVGVFKGGFGDASCYHMGFDELTVSGV